MDSIASALSLTLFWIVFNRGFYTSAPGLSLFQSTCLRDCGCYTNILGLSLYQIRHSTVCGFYTSVSISDDMLNRFVDFTQVFLASVCIGLCIELLVDSTSLSAISDDMLNSFVNFTQAF